MNYDKLSLSVETDGSITAPDAVAKAATILITYFEKFQDLATEEKMIEVPGNAVQDEDSSEIPQEQVDLSQIPIEELELSVRAFNCLKGPELIRLTSW